MGNVQARGSCAAYTSTRYPRPVTADILMKPAPLLSPICLLAGAASALGYFGFQRACIAIEFLFAGVSLLVVTYGRPRCFFFFDPRAAWSSGT